MAFIIIFFFLKKFEKVEKVGYHSNFNPECNTERGSKESLSIALGSRSVLNDQVWNENTLQGPVSMTLLWSIKREKWFRGPDLHQDLNLPGFQRMCPISVGLNTAFVLNREYMFSFNFKNKIWQNHKSPPALLVQGNGYQFESCALHLQKDYHRYNS